LSTVPNRHNPVLGRLFQCRCDYLYHTQGFFIGAHGVPAPHSLCLSHQPYSITPLTLSTFFYISPMNKVSIVQVGELQSMSKFLGDSVSTMMEGENCIPLMGAPEHSKYLVTMLNMKVYGTLCRKMVIELGDT
ncbi:hypothetical protein EI94DRAFT_1843243, partial [Lactarius quietus]